MTSRATTEVVGIVLAGGRARRFGRDKLAELLDGRPLLHHALSALDPIATEILMVIPPTGPAPAWPSGLHERRRRLVRDPEPFGGPLVALLAALQATSAPTALLVGGDMPSLQAPVLTAMVAALDERAADVVLLGAPGPVQSIPAALRTAQARTAAEAIVSDGGRALRALYDRLRVAVLPLAEWSRLDPARATLRDVDTPADLRGPGPATT